MEREIGMKYASIFAVILLAACGVDGEPEAPTKSAKSGPGVSVAISGRAEAGVAKRW